MLDDEKLEGAMRDLLMDLCEVMAAHGYELVSIGSLMRLVGVDESVSADHDDEYFALDNEFHAMVALRASLRSRAADRSSTDEPGMRSAPAGATLH